MVPVQMTSTTMELVALVSLCVLTRCGTTFAAEHGTSAVTVAVEEGRDAILPCSLSTKENIENMVFDWKKDDDKEVFLYDAGLHYNQGRTGQDEQFTGRVFHFEDELKNGNASIKIQNTKMDDNGSYSCTFPGKQNSLIILAVDPDPERSILKDRRHENIPGAAPEPSILTLNQTNNWALLRCIVRGASPKPKVEWQDSDGNILQAERPQVTERGGRYDVILQTIVTRADNYRCEATQEEIKHQIHAETYVLLSGAAPEPSVMILEQTNDWALLKCVIRGASPKPVVQWQDSDRNIIPAKEPQVSERGGSYDIILQTTVTKTDNYRCVATQEEIKHKVQAETHVYISGPGFPTVVSVAVGVGVSCLVLGGVVVYVCMKKQHPKPGPSNTNQLL